MLQLGARTQDAAHLVIHDLRQKLAPDCILVFTSYGLNLYFYALTAHFGEWVAGVGRRACQWQVAAELIYGRVKKVYRQRKLVRVTHIKRCGTRAALRLALSGLGLSGTLNTAFVERLKKDGAAECGCLGATDVVHGPGSAAVAPAFRAVARVLSLCPTA